MKECTKCHIKKPYNEFYSDHRKNPPVQPCCKMCFRRRAKKYRESTVGLKVIRKHQRSPIERIRVKNFLKTYRKTRKYKDWRNDYYQKYNKEYRKRPYVKIGYIIRTHKYASAKRGNADGTVSKIAILKLLQKQKNRCKMCCVDLRKTKKHIDHIKPVSKGGKHSMSNIQWLCAHCNVTKSNKIL